MELVDLRNDPWLWGFFENAKSHVVHQDFFPDLMADLEAREHPYTGHLPMGFMLLDAPGPIFIGRPMETINLDGLSIQIPCDDWLYIENVIMESPLRRFSSGSVYHKIHVWNNALVINERQCERLLDEMEARWERVLEASERFLDERLKNS